MKRALVLVGIVVVLLSGFLAWNLFGDNLSHKNPTEPSSSLRDQRLTLETVETAEDKTKGLSGRDSLDNNAAMLFVYDPPGTACMWMKDMKFSIDMIWLDGERKVIHTERNVSPESYPKTFCSPKPASYVLELNAGEVERLGVQEGDQLSY